MTIKILNKIEDIHPTDWKKIKPSSYPFLNYQFFKALEDSQSVGLESGWEPLYFYHPDALLYTFNKTNSYGEYIFDWQWADAYYRAGRSYFPKLTSMVPFTPATTPHFIMPEFNFDVATTLLETYEDYYQAQIFSSSHFLFLSHDEVNLFKTKHYILRDSLQYHFFNENYSDFDNFLKTLKSKKASNIKKERNFPPSITIKKITGNDLKSHHAQEMYRFYLSTIYKKGSQAYLNQKFFSLIFETMKTNLLYIQATQEDCPIAGALYFYDDQKLYGRYWGSTQDESHLHFELCYYQGIEFCIENKLNVFEAGAQGEHKISRGFRPVKIRSAHQLKDKDFSKAVENFVIEERKYIEQVMEELNKSLPFKSK